jgi:hypothetical protein
VAGFIGTLASNERDQPPFVSGLDAPDGSSAKQRYTHAQALDAEGKYDEARTEYLVAKDRDELRFRAPESFHALIRELAGSAHWQGPASGRPNGRIVAQLQRLTLPTATANPLPAPAATTAASRMATRSP